MAKAQQPEILAAGTVLIRTVGRDRQVCLVHRPTYQDWSLPKGKLEPGEHVVAAAWRETGEETGEHVVLGVPLPTQTYPVEGKLKQVDYWLGRVTKGGPGFRPNVEIDKLAWLSPRAAAAKLTYPRDRDLVKLALRSPTTSPLIILRHAQAMRRARWGKRPDSRRPLTVDGRAAAKKLTGVLEAFGVRSVHSSDASRCVDTVADFARNAGAKIVEESSLSERGFESSSKTGLRRIARLLRIEAPIVVCTHRPLLPDLLERLGKELGTKSRTALDPSLPPGGFLVLHRRFVGGDQIRLAAVERHEI